MRKFQYVMTGLVFISLSPVFSQSLSSPLVPDYGKIWDMPSVQKPDTNLTYRIVIDLKTNMDNPERINRGLDNVARMLNLHATGGISAANIEVAVAIHGGATGIILDNQAYRKRYGVDNPNLGLFTQLRATGTELFVCGQSLIARGFDPRNVNPDIDVALSMLTVVTERMMQGYGLLVFQ